VCPFGEEGGRPRVWFEWWVVGVRHHDGGMRGLVRSLAFGGLRGRSGV
jgi:hypothetical protein